MEEITAVMRAAGNDPEGIRLRGVIVLLWRAGRRISEVLALTESDLDPARGPVPGVRACRARDSRPSRDFYCEGAWGGSVPD